MDNIIYILINEAMPGYVKIGKTNNLEQRIRSLDTTSIKVFQVIEGGGDMSKELRNSSVSRIKFGVSINRWTKEELARQIAEVNRISSENYNKYSVI